VLNNILNLFGSLNGAFNTSVAFSGTILKLQFLYELVDDIGLNYRVLSASLHVLDDASHHDRVLLVLVVRNLHLVAGLRLFDNRFLNLWHDSLRSIGGSLGSSHSGLLVHFKEVSWLSASVESLSVGERGLGLHVLSFVSLLCFLLAFFTSFFVDAFL